ncbi:hypothetical protein BpHYR1_010302 [Brachionus plicatilis]|uniref:Uncharacterized protein n=1 Tax=Brachionus plicatilis TaxID=10195 RepID=A0A3M7PBR2_BRAPC|nr:hypothetical protein BpHYR1_010302 [Brachionus plicatilis]
METFFNNKFNDKFEKFLRNRNKNNDLFKDIDNYLYNDDIGRKIRFNCNKLIRYKNHMNIFEVHKEQQTRPKNLFFCEFPRPFFQESEAYVEKHNKLIEKCQDEFTKLILDELEERKNSLELKNEDLKKELFEKQNDLEFDINDLFRQAYSVEEKKLSKILIESKRKAERCKVVKYVAKIYEINGYNSTSNSNQSNYSTNDASFYKVKSSTPKQDNHVKRRYNNNYNKNTNYKKNVSFADLTMNGDDDECSFNQSRTKPASILRRNNMDKSNSNHFSNNSNPKRGNFRTRGRSRGNN